jgi:hypothetical protein
MTPHNRTQNHHQRRCLSELHPQRLPSAPRPSRLRTQIPMATGMLGQPTCRKSVIKRSANQTHLAVVPSSVAQVTPLMGLAGVQRWEGAEPEGDTQNRKAQAGGTHEDGTQEDGTQAGGTQEAGTQACGEQACGEQAGGEQDGAAQAGGEQAGGEQYGAEREGEAQEDAVPGGSARAGEAWLVATVGAEDLLARHATSPTTVALPLASASTSQSRH